MKRLPPLTSEVVNTVLKESHLNELEPLWFGGSAKTRGQDFGFNIKRGVTEAGMIPASSLAEITDQQAVVKAAMESAGKAQLGVIHKADQRWDRDQDAENLVRAAIKVLVAGNKVLKNLANSDRVETGLLGTLKETRPEMLVVIAKNRGGRSIAWKAYPVTQKELVEANYDRTAAAEMVIYKAKERNGRGGWVPSVLDMLSITRPEALAYLNETKDQEERSAKLEAVKETNKRGARQSRGVVAGLSAKDLRGGKASDVIANLTNATLADQAKVVSKTKLWEAPPDWATLRSPEDGSTAMEPVVAAWFAEVRKKNSQVNRQQTLKG